MYIALIIAGALALAGCAIAIARMDNNPVTVEDGTVEREWDAH